MPSIAPERLMAVKRHLFDIPADRAWFNCA
jgi:hypothetical protein